MRAIRGLEWKYIRSDEGTDELYRIDEDPGERHNVADSHRDVVRKMTEELARCESGVRSFSATGEPRGQHAPAGTSIAALIEPERP